MVTLVTGHQSKSQVTVHSDERYPCLKSGPSPTKRELLRYDQFHFSLFLPSIASAVTLQVLGAVCVTVAQHGRKSQKGESVRDEGGAGEAQRNLEMVRNSIGRFISEQKTVGRKVQGT